EPFLLQPRKNEIVDRRLGPGDLSRDVAWPRNLRPLDLQIRPVTLPLGAFVDPGSQDFDFLLLEPFSGLRRRHDFVVARACDAGDQLALAALARQDGVPAGFQSRQGRLLSVQAQSGLTLALVRAMAGVAVLRQDGPHVAVVVDWPLRLIGGL